MGWGGMTSGVALQDESCAPESLLRGRGLLQRLSFPLTPGKARQGPTATPEQGRPERGIQRRANPPRAAPGRSPAGLVLASLCPTAPRLAPSALPPPPHPARSGRHRGALGPWSASRSGAKSCAPPTPGPVWAMPLSVLRPPQPPGRVLRTAGASARLQPSPPGPLRIVRFLEGMQRHPKRPAFHPSLPSSSSSTPRCGMAGRPPPLPPPPLQKTSVQFTHKGRRCCTTQRRPGPSSLRRQIAGRGAESTEEAKLHFPGCLGEGKKPRWCRPPRGVSFQ